MRLMRSHRWFLVIGYGLLVTSIFFPFATDFSRTFVTGPYTGPALANRCTFWSFMHVQEGLARINDTWVVTWVQWLSFSQYWDWWGPGTGDILPSSILIPTFSLQITAVLLGLVTLLKANTTKKLLPALLATLGLNYLYFAGSQSLHSEVFIGFWLSLVSTWLIIIAILSMHACKNQHSSTAPTD